MMTIAQKDALAAALAYRTQGSSVIPLEPGGKRPLIRWEAFQQSSAPGLHEGFGHTGVVESGLEMPRACESRMLLEVRRDPNLPVDTGQESSPALPCSRSKATLVLRTRRR
jgi:hypothetical protein